MCVCVCVTDCTAGQFRCDNGQCVTVYLLCGGYSYCTDGSDQANCSKCFVSLSLHCAVNSQYNSNGAFIRCCLVATLLVIYHLARR